MVYLMSQYSHILGDDPHSTSRTLKIVRHELIHFVKSPFFRLFVEERMQASLAPWGNLTY